MFFYYPLASQVATHCQYLDQNVIKNMKCYYRADFIRNVIHYLGLIPALQSWCNIKVPLLMLPGPGVMFKVEESNEFGENAFIPFIHLSTSVRLCLSFWLLTGIWLKIRQWVLTEHLLCAQKCPIFNNNKKQATSCPTWEKRIEIHLWLCN